MKYIYPFLLIVLLPILFHFLIVLLFFEDEFFRGIYLSIYLFMVIGFVNLKATSSYIQKTKNYRIIVYLFIFLYIYLFIFLFFTIAFFFQ